MKLKELMTEDNILLIVPNDKKKQVLRKLNKEELIYSVKLMSKEEFLEHYCFTYTEKTIAYCFEKYDYSYEIILEYLSILPSAITIIFSQISATPAAIIARTSGTAAS